MKKAQKTKKNHIGIGNPRVADVLGCWPMMRAGEVTGYRQQGCRTEGEKKGRWGQWQIEGPCMGRWECAVQRIIVNKLHLRPFVWFIHVGTWSCRSIYDCCCIVFHHTSMSQLICSSCDGLFGAISAALDFLLPVFSRMSRCISVRLIPQSGVGMSEGVHYVRF